MDGKVTPINPDFVSLDDEAEFVKDIHEVVDRYIDDKNISTSHVIGVLEIVKLEIMQAQMEAL